MDHGMAETAFIRAARIGLLGIGVGALWALTTYGTLSPMAWLPKWLLPSNRSKKETREETLIEILRSLCDEVHPIFSELAQVSANVKKSMKSRDLQGALTPEQLESVLMQQGFRQRLQCAEGRVLKKYGITTTELECAAKQFPGDPTIAALTKGLHEMYSSALEGVLPLLPGQDVPDALKSQEQMLQILSAVHTLKAELFEEIFEAASAEDLASVNTPAGSLPSPQLNAKLTAASEEAETRVIREHLGEGTSERLYYHALAWHSRNEEFQLKKAVMDELHSDRVVEIMKRGMFKTSSIVFLHESLEHVKADELTALLQSADETRILVFLIVSKTNSPSGMRLLDSLSQEITKFEKVYGKQTKKIGSNGLKEAEGKGSARRTAVGFFFTEAEEFKKAKIEGHPSVDLTQPPLWLVFKGSQLQRQSIHMEESFRLIRQLTEKTNSPSASTKQTKPSSASPQTPKEQSASVPSETPMTTASPAALPQRPEGSQSTSRATRLSGRVPVPSPVESTHSSSCVTIPAAMPAACSPAPCSSSNGMPGNMDGAMGYGLPSGVVPCDAHDSRAAPEGFGMENAKLSSMGTAKEASRDNSKATVFVSISPQQTTTADEASKGDEVVDTEEPSLEVIAELGAAAGSGVVTVRPIPVIAAKSGVVPAQPLPPSEVPQPPSGEVSTTGSPSICRDDFEGSELEAKQIEQSIPKETKSVEDK